MALKAGRVGVAKDQVDEFGRITGGSTPENVYTKSQCDNKFETKTHADNTFQPMTLAVPLTMLNGSVLETVSNNEDALGVLNDNKLNSADVGGLKFRDNDGTAQYQLPNGEWTNFSSGGSDNVIDLSSLSPETTDRISIIALFPYPSKSNGIIIYSDSARTIEIGRATAENNVVVLKDMPNLIYCYYRILYNNEVATSGYSIDGLSGSGSCASYNGSDKSIRAAAAVGNPGSPQSGCVYFY